MGTTGFLLIAEAGLAFPTPAHWSFQITEYSGIWEADPADQKAGRWAGGRQEGKENQDFCDPRP